MTKLSLLLLVTASLLAQTTPSTTGSVSGRVLDSDTRKPLSGVRVGSAEMGYVVTDSEGRYTVSGITPGRARIAVRVDQLVYSDPKMVTVVAGRETSGVDFQTRLHADITGYVRDEDGNPISGVQVGVIQSEYTANGELRYEFGNAYYGTSAATKGTDAEGKYTVKVSAGRQFWLFAFRVRRYGQPISDAPIDPASRLPSYVSVFYPNAKTISAATPIVLESQETRNVDFRLERAPSYCLSATLNAGVNPPDRPMSFILSEEESSGLENRGFPMVGQGDETRGDGKIRVCDLTPGDYRLTAFRYAPAGAYLPALEYYNAAPVKISNADVENIVVNTSPRITVPGNVELLGQQPLDSTDVKLRFRLDPPAAMRAQTWQIPQQFSFDTAPVLDSELDLSGLTPPFYVKDVFYAGVSILGKAFIPSAGATLRVIVGRDAGSVIAHVADKAGQPAAYSHVILFSAKAATLGELAATLHEGLTGQNGSYSSPSLLPGRYSVFATDAPLPMLGSGDVQAARVIRMPAILEMLMRTRAKGEMIDVGPNSKVQVSLVPIAVN